MKELALRDEVGTLLQRHETEAEHVLQVARLALRLYDGLAPWHQFGAAERRLLDTAACLHDLGWSLTGPDGKGHHKESARLIREFPWTALAGEEIELVALVARYHRKALPSPQHDPYARQPAQNRQRVRRLAAILRVADALDRRHLQRVDRAEIRLAESALEIVVLSTHEVGPELSTAEAKADLLRAEFGGPVRFVTR